MKSDRKQIRRCALRFLVCALAAHIIALPATGLFAEPVGLKLARVLSHQKKFDESLAKYREYLARHPGESRIHMEVGDVYFWNRDYTNALSEYAMAARNPKLKSQIRRKTAEVMMAKGDLKGAQAIFRDMVEANPRDMQARLKLAQALSYENNYNDSIAEYDRIIEMDPGNITALSERADVLSWAGRHGESVAAYDKCLAVKYDPDVARQKARVLGWQKKYGKSLKAYDDAYDHTRIDAIKDERSAKQAFWNGWVKGSLKRYRKLVNEEPANVEALFDLAQTEAYQGMWREAEADFRAIIDQAPWHFRARESLKRAEILKKGATFRPQFSWFAARSQDRAVHINRFTPSATIDAPVSQALALTAGYAFDFFSYDGAASIPRHQGSVGARLSLQPNIWASAAYMPTGYPSDNRFSHLFDTRVHVRPFDPVVIGAFVRRDDMTSSRNLFIEKLRTTDVGGSVEAHLHRRLTSLADYKYSIVSDGNRENTFGIEQLFYIFYEPTRLTLDARVDFQDWKQDRGADYFSPHNFWGGTATLHWRHYLNKNGLYFGALNTYYGLKYRFMYDAGKHPFNGGAVEFYHDFNRRISVQIEGTGIYSSVYKDCGVTFALIGHF